jgi:hypothetical protein
VFLQYSLQLPENKQDEAKIRTVRVQYNAVQTVRVARKDRRLVWGHGNWRWEADGSIDISKALQVNTEFDLSRQLWAYLVKKGAIRDPQTGILRHSRIQTTLDLHTQEDSDEARVAQGEFLKAVGVHSGMTQ